MASLSQFSFYSSADWGAPRLNGLSGSLLTLLDACLVTGYGSGSLVKFPIGWLKPIPNDPSYALGCFQQPSGSGMTLFVNDVGAFSSSTSWTREAWVCGWEEMLGLTGSSYLKVMGTGGGQFPYENQVGISTLPHGGNTGSVIWRKSNTLNDTERPWMLYGDAHTFYLFVMTGDSAISWNMFMFGDIYSYKKTRDAYKCMIAGRLITGAGIGVQFGDLDFIFSISYGTYPNFMARTAGGGQRACRVARIGDGGKFSFPAAEYTLMTGRTTCPGAVDGNVYISPIWIGEPDISTVRGMWRGIWTLAHNTTNLQDGQIITGTGDVAGRLFRMVKPSSNLGQWVVEISNTVPVNDV